MSALEDARATLASYDSMTVYRGQSPAGFGLWREYVPGRWVFSVPTDGFVWRTTDPPDMTKLVELVDARLPQPVTEEQVEAAWAAGAAEYGDTELPGGRDRRAMRAALEAAQAAIA